MTHILITDLREIRYMASNGESLPFDRVEDRIKIIGLISSTIRIPCSLLDLEPDLYQVPVEKPEIVSVTDCKMQYGFPPAVCGSVNNCDCPVKQVARLKSSAMEPFKKFTVYEEGQTITTNHVPYEPKEESQEDEAVRFAMYMSGKCTVGDQDYFRQVFKNKHWTTWKIDN